MSPNVQMKGVEGSHTGDQLPSELPVSTHDRSYSWQHWPLGSAGVSSLLAGPLS